MKSRYIRNILTAGTLSLVISACATPAAQTTPTNAPAVPLATVAPLATAAPTAAAGSTDLTQPATGATSLGGIMSDGEIVAAQDASLLFVTQGTVKEVLVKEGDLVTAGQVLATLETRALDLQVAQAEAGLAGAKAQLASLDEGPRSADLAAAQAQVAAVQAQLTQLKAGAKAQDIASVRAGLDAAQANLQAQRNGLSAAKVRAQSALEQAANMLRNAQDSYSQVYWQNRQTEKQRPGVELPQAAKDAEEAALRGVANAEEGLRQAQLAVDNAVQTEQTGIRAAEQQVAQQQAMVDKILLPPTPDQIAGLESQLAAARSQVDRLKNPTTASTRAQRAAAIAQATAALDSAKYNRSLAELKAPFAGTVAQINIDVGDPSSSAGASAIRLLDISRLTAEINVSDVDIARIKIGQQASIVIQSLPDTPFTGRVEYIAPAATVSGNVRSYLVRLAIDNQTGLLTGMRVRAYIEK